MLPTLAHLHPSRCLPAPVGWQAFRPAVNPWLVNYQQRLQRECGEGGTDNAKIRELEEQYKSVLRKQDQLVDKNDVLESKLARRAEILEGEMEEELRNLRKEMERQEQELQAEVKRLRLRNVLNGVYRRLLRTSSTTKTRTIEDLRRSLEQLRVEAQQQLAKTKANAEVEAEAERVNLANRAELIAKLETELNARVVAASEAEAKIKGMQAAIESGRADAAGKAAELQVALGERAVAEAAAAEATGRLAEAKVEMERMRAELQEVEAEAAIKVAALEARVAAAMETIEELQRTKEVAEATMLAEIDGSDATASDMATRLQALQNERDELLAAAGERDAVTNMQEPEWLSVAEKQMVEASKSLQGDDPQQELLDAKTKIAELEAEVVALTEMVNLGNSSLPRVKEDMAELMRRAGFKDSELLEDAHKMDDKDRRLR